MTLHYNKLFQQINEKPLPYGMLLFPNRQYGVVQDAQSFSAGVKTRRNMQDTWNTKNMVTEPTSPKVTSEAIIACANSPAKINAIAAGAVAQIPIILAELTVYINLSSFIDLPEWAKEIKDIKKRVVVTQCLLLQDTKTLFIKGFVKENIRYIKQSHSYLAGEMRDFTVEIPFKCTTVVKYNGTDPVPVVSSSSVEFEYRKEDRNSDDLREINRISTACYNERPFCELTGSKIVEVDEFPAQQGIIKNIEEKMVIHLTLKILQYCKIVIPAPDTKLK